MPGPDLKTELGLVPEADVAAFRSMTIPALRNERSRGMGPPYQKFGKKIFYPLEKLRAHLAASEITPAKARSLIDSKSRRHAKA